MRGADPEFMVTLLPPASKQEHPPRTNAPGAIGASADSAKARSSTGFCFTHSGTSLLEADSPGNAADTAEIRAGTCVSGIPLLRIRTGELRP